MNINLDRRIKKVWYLRNIILSVIFLTIAIILYCFLPIKSVAILVDAFILVIIILLLIWPKLKYKYACYSLLDDRIIIRRGVIFQHEIIIPFVQIQDLHLYQGPLMLIYKVSGVIISTAGSNYGLVGLTKNNAEELISLFEKRMMRLEEEQNASDK